MRDSGSARRPARVGNTPKGMPGVLLAAALSAVPAGPAPFISNAGAADPVQVLPRVTIPSPVDRPYGGAIELAVDATDVAHRIFSVREIMPLQGSGPVTLLYPRWESASHGPSLSVAALAGLDVRAEGRSVAWRRDAVEPHAFHLDVPKGATRVEVRFQVVSDAEQLSADQIAVEWQRLLLYPAGWYARDIAIAASLTLPGGLTPFTSLEASQERAFTTRFASVSMETLLDSPVVAGRHAVRIPLSPDGEGAVALDLVGPTADGLSVPRERAEELRRMVIQARRVFGDAPFRRYEVLARMIEGGSSGGTEHRASAQISMDAGYFRDWSGQLNNRDIVAHEFVHAWNGLHRVPSDLWAPTPNVPQAGSLLWVYEGQTEFWARVLAARSGLRSVQETLDRLALDAAEAADRPGRAWRPLSDDVNYPSFMLRQPVPWRDWQRRKDYYLEGVMLWLDVEAILRERSSGRRGVDDLARAFFGGAAPGAPARTYAFADVCAALNAIAPSDWASFLRGWLDGHEEVDVTQGLGKLGWRLAWGGEETATFAQNEREMGGADLSHSIGATVDDAGRVLAVTWNGPAFRAGLAPGTRIVSVDGAAYSRPALLEAVRDSARSPIRLVWEQDGRRIAAVLAYRGGPRYPRLERIVSRPDGLTALLAPR